MTRALLRNWPDFRRDWPGLTAYQKFEAHVATFNYPPDRLLE
jgi:hypothetical protein